MRESFLHFLWRWRRFHLHALCTTQGQPLEILHPGEWNTHAGPDFFNARIRLGDTLWAGNVEIHLRSSDWMLHGHQRDPAYDNVVLHVVLEEDLPAMHTSGERIPCLELKERIPANILDTYQRLEQERAWIPCESFFAQTPDIVRLNWLDRLLVERLEQKTEAIATLLEATGNHWEEAFYRLLARNFGLKVNAQPFEMLAASLPLSVLAKHRSNAFQIEALLFGQAGLLAADFQEEYPAALAKEYRFLQHKYQLAPIESKQWKFLRLRPANFPSIRLAQFSALLHRSAPLLSQILEVSSLRQIEHLFSVEPGEYWLTHFQLDKPSAKRSKTPGRDFIHLLTINTIVPFLFHYGRQKHTERYEKRAMHLLESLPAESNAVLDGWRTLGIEARHAYQSQALLHLKTRYCDAQRCLECAVGNAILK
ncbi:MAG: DUF2851 family protein [Saprospiraceae bacterium]|nr:DUF2851 family protein [Saprospiraceae bacterium]